MTTPSTVGGVEDAGPQVEGAAPAARFGHEPALDGLRGLAVAAVLFFHGGHLTGGYLGVDAFFVLSGFLITSLLLTEVRSTGRVALGHFWIRRARRLLPALFLVLAAVALYAAFVAKPEDLASIRGDALATLAYVANWREVFASSDYFALFRSPSPLQHTWSLAIEEQFYVFWPLVVVVATRRCGPAESARRMLLVSGVLALLSFGIMQVLFDPANTNRVYYGTDTRIASILIGAALASWISLKGHVGRARRTPLEVAAVVSLVFLAIAWFRLDGGSPRLYRGGLLLCAFAVAVVIAAGVHPQRGPVAHALSWKPLTALGIISYGAYLWHWPIYVYLDADRVGLTGWPLLGVRLAVTLVVAIASYRFLEKPIRYGTGARGIFLRIIPAVAVVLVVLILVSTAGATSNDASGNDVERGGVLVVGDSVAHTITPGLRRAGIPVAESWSPGCRLLTGELPFKNEFSNNCPWKESWRRAFTRQQPDVVLLAIGAWDLFDLKPPGSDHFMVPGTNEWTAYYEAQLEAAITLLGRDGTPIVIPNLPCQGVIAGEEHFNERSSVNVERVRILNAALARVVARHADQVTSPDLFTKICPAGKYQKGLDDVQTMRYDGVHFSDEGSEIVASFLGPELEPFLPNGAAKAPSGPARVVKVFGDSFIVEAKASILDELTFDKGYRTSVDARPLAAMCDLLELLEPELQGQAPDIVVLETHGGGATPCMRDGAGAAITPGSEAYWTRYAADAERFFARVAKSGARLLVVSPPPDGVAGAKVAATRVEQILSDLVAKYPNASVSDAGRLALGGETWTATMPCLAEEGVRQACQDGRIPVRGPDRQSLCPLGYPTLNAVRVGCREYNSGAVRYGRGVADAVVAATGSP